MNLCDFMANLVYIGNARPASQGYVVKLWGWGAGKQELSPQSQCHNMTTSLYSLFLLEVNSARVCVGHTPVIPAMRRLKVGKLLQVLGQPGQSKTQEKQES